MGLVPSFRSDKGKWKARCRHAGQEHHLGYFATREEAAAAEQKFREANPTVRKKPKAHDCPKHPSSTCYTTHKCRCDECRELNARKSRNWRRNQDNSSKDPKPKKSTPVWETYEDTFTIEEYYRHREGAA